MPCFAQALDLADDPALIDEYVRLHENVWPEVLAALRQIGITKMSIFRLGSRLFMYAEAVEGFDPARDYHAYTADPRCREWDAFMRRFQRQAPGATSANWWTPMTQIFSL